jgi:hypothetical protein
MCKYLANAEINVIEDGEGMAIAPQKYAFLFRYYLCFEIAYRRLATFRCDAY